MGYRILDIDGEEYGYIFCRNGDVKVKGPEGKGSKIAPLHELLGIKIEELRVRQLAHYDCDHSDSFCLAPHLPEEATPKMVVRWIRENF